MAGCALTGNIGTKECKYAVAGVASVLIANWYPAVEATAAADGVIGYQIDPTTKEVTGIFLPTGEFFYKLKGEQNTMSATDALLVGGNGGKYRQHTVNAVVNQLDVDMLDQGDALSLGTFILVVTDKSGRTTIYGRTSGLTAPAGGFDFNTGAAEADATGWTIIMQGSSMEIAPLLQDVTVAIPVKPDPVITP